MYNTFLPKLGYMNMLFQYEQVNITMYAWPPHGATYKYIGDTTGQEDSDCELEVISFQGTYISSQVIDHTSFQEFPIPLNICANATSPVKYNYTALLQRRANRTEYHWDGTAITDYIPPILETDSFIMTHCKDITNNIKPLHNISEASNGTIRWWHTAGMQFGEGISFHTHTGVPYNFYMLLPVNEQWGIVDLMAQKLCFGENPKHVYYTVDWDQICIFPASFHGCHICDSSDTPCIMD
jgi:hypothetical protein